MLSILILSKNNNFPNIFKMKKKTSSRVCIFVESLYSFCVFCIPRALLFLSSLLCEFITWCQWTTHFGREHSFTYFHHRYLFVDFCAKNIKIHIFPPIFWLFVSCYLNKARVENILLKYTKLLSLTYNKICLKIKLYILA